MTAEMIHMDTALHLHKTLLKKEKEGRLMLTDRCNKYMNRNSIIQTSLLHRTTRAKHLSYPSRVIQVQSRKWKS